MRALLILSTLFIVFGSLYPFDIDLSLWATRSMSRFDDHVGLADVVANIALFLPYGFAARSLPRRWWWAAFGIFVALIVQVAQDVIPDRSPSLWDVVNNTIGLAIGWGIGSLLRGRKLAPRLPASLFVPAVCYVGYELAPFAPTLDIGLLRAHLKLFFAGAIDPGDVLRNAVQALILAVLLALALPVATVRRLLLLLLPLLALSRLIIIDNGVGPGGVAGLVAGAVLMFAVPLRAPPVRVFAMLAAIALVLWSGLTPLVWRPQPIMLQLVPFAGLFSGNWLGSLVSLAWKIFIYGSIVEIGKRDTGRVAAVLAVVAAAVVEGSQMFIASGVPETTDVVIAAGLAWLLPQLDAGQPAPRAERRAGQPKPRAEKPKFKVRPGRSYR